MDLIKNFDELITRDTSKFGGKAASLGELIKAGFPVPPGFAITASADRQFRAKGMSPEFSAALQKAYKMLKSPSVAVRSSALAEDSSSASWAGQLESFLDVTESDLEEAIKECWASANSRRVTAYAKDKQRSQDDLLVGVAVQTMMHPDAAGVMFTTNPITGGPGIIIEATFGLGEMVVQGAVTPDHYETDTLASTVTSYHIATKHAAMFAQNGKHVQKALNQEMQQKPVLTHRQVKELAKIGLKIAIHFSHPQDIEWCLQDGTFWIVQSRPITTIDK